MTQKSKDTFNLDDKKVYKYNFIKPPRETISDYMVILSPLVFSSPTLSLNNIGNVIDEYYIKTEVIDSKRRLHKIQFTINN